MAFPEQLLHGYLPTLVGAEVELHSRKVRTGFLAAESLLVSCPSLLGSPTGWWQKKAPRLTEPVFFLRRKSTGHFIAQACFLPIGQKHISRRISAGYGEH